MNHFKISAITISILAILLGLHLMGMANHLYVTYWFYDIILHFLAGIAVGISTICIAELCGIEFIKNRLWITLIIVLVAGISWELFELYFDISGYGYGTHAYNVDTVKDLIMDMLGGFLIYFIFRKR